MRQLISLDNQVLTSFLFYGALLIGKTLFMSVFTAFWRFRKGVFISPEDKFTPGTKVGIHDDDIERVRRAHQNDLENISMFLGTGLIYVLTSPNTFLAVNLFRVYTVCRFLHTFVYAVVVIPQPTRAIVWGVAYAINWYMFYRRFYVSKSGIQQHNMNQIIVDDTAFRSFMFYAALLVGKTMIMSPYTAFWRFKKGVFISSEDVVLSGTKVSNEDEDVEHVRRAHRNDIENITMFLATGFIYILTSPDPELAVQLFRAYTLCRLLHTYVYVVRVVSQPARLLTWAFGYAITWFMLLSSIIHFYG